MQSIFSYIIGTSKQTAIISLYLTGFCNRDGMCLLRSPNWLMKGLMMFFDVFLYCLRTRLMTPRTVTKQLRKDSS